MKPDYIEQLIKDARGELPETARMRAYYYEFGRTGVGVVDAILSEVADAGKAWHNTSGWVDEYDEGYERNGSTKCHQDRIQDAAEKASSVVAELVGALESTLESFESVKALQVDDRRTAIDAIDERDRINAALSEWVDEVGELACRMVQKLHEAMTPEESAAYAAQMDGMRTVLLLFREKLRDA